MPAASSKGERKTDLVKPQIKKRKGQIPETKQRPWMGGTVRAATKDMVFAGTLTIGEKKNCKQSNPRRAKKISKHLCANVENRDKRNHKEKTAPFCFGYKTIYTLGLRKITGQQSRRRGGVTSGKRGRRASIQSAFRGRKAADAGGKKVWYRQTSQGGAQYSNTKDVSAKKKDIGDGKEPDESCLV